MNWLREELGKISDSEIKIPNTEIKPGEVLIGQIESMEVKKIYALRKRILLEINNLIESASSYKALDVIKESLSDNHDPATCKNCILQRQLKLLNKKKEMLDELFWTCVWFELSEDALIKIDKHDSIGIRDNWQIVANQETSDGIIIGIGLPI